VIFKKGVFIYFMITIYIITWNGGKMIKSWVVVKEVEVQISFWTCCDYDHNGDMMWVDSSIVQSNIYIYVLLLLLLLFIYLLKIYIAMLTHSFSHFNQINVVKYLA
jgi:hypothetical protein